MWKQISLLIFLFLTSFSSYGQENKCPTWPLGDVEEVNCNCNDELENLVITIPNGFKVMSVCLENPFSSPPRLIDLKKEKISLDETTNGNLPYGSVHLKGKFIIKGKVSVDLSPSYIFSFYPGKPFSQVNTAFGSILSEFYFWNAEDMGLFNIDQTLLNKGCSVASATIQAEGLRVQIGGKEEGAYPVGIKVINISKYKPCKS